MTWLALGLLGFAVADLLQWSPTRGPGWRTAVSVAGGAGVVAGVAALAGMDGGEVTVATAIAVVLLAVWLLLPSSQPGWPLAWILVALTTLFALAGSSPAIGGDIDRWYSGLSLPFVSEVDVEQFVIGVAAVLFLLATANKIVRLVLEAAGSSPEKGESSLRGGRLLGPMERLIVAAVVVAGEPTGAAIVIAAKSLLRFPEIKGDDDSVTEYFLIGTFSSLLLAGLMAVLVLASG